MSYRGQINGSCFSQLKCLSKDIQVKGLNVRGCFSQVRGVLEQLIQLHPFSLPYFCIPDNIMKIMCVWYWFWQRPFAKEIMVRQQFVVIYKINSACKFPRTWNFSNKNKSIWNSQNQGIRNFGLLWLNELNSSCMEPNIIQECLWYTIRNITN